MSSDRCFGTVFGVWIDASTDTEREDSDADDK